MRDKNTNQILKELNHLLDPSLSLHTLSFEFHKIAARVKSSGKKIKTLTNLEVFSDNTIMIQFCAEPSLNTVLRDLYEKSKKKFDKNSLTVFYYFQDTFLGILNKDNVNQQLLVNLIESHNLPST